MNYKEYFDINSLENSKLSAIEDPATSVDNKYKDMYTIVYKVAANKSLYNHVLIAGDAGIGKSYTVGKAVEQGGKDSGREVLTFHGSIGKAVSDVIAFLYKYKDNKILVLDDCDDFLLGDQAVMNIFKAALDPSGHSVTISDTMRSRVADKLTESTLQEIGEWDTLKSLYDDNVDDTYTTVVEPEKPIVKDTDYTVKKDTSKSKKNDIQLPEKFDFNSNIIMISNLKPEQIDNAFKSRCAIYVIALSHQEFIIRLNQIKDTLLSKPIQKEPIWKINWAKNCVINLLTQVINREGKNLFGKPVRITQPLEFRQVTARTQDWINLVDPYLAGVTQEPNKETLDKIENAVAATFVEKHLLPHL